MSSPKNSNAFEKIEISLTENGFIWYKLKINIRNKIGPKMKIDSFL
jgi:hypothetical protein